MKRDMSTPLRATLVGSFAILLWSSLATLTAASGAVPPFLMTALTFAIGGALGLAVAARRPNGLAALRQPWPVWLHGVGGLFGYHACYFAALRLAPPVEASLIGYLWPLLIVLLSAFLPGGGLSLRHVLGALLGLGGAALIIGGRSGGFGFDAAYAPGYAAAFACALLWSGYSVASRLFQTTPTEAVAGFCVATAVLAALCHLAFEATVWPQGTVAWAAVAGLGLGPVGLAFYVWDVGMKRGDVRLLGVLSYAAPLLSTLLLIAAGYAQATPTLAVACGLIVAGALVATFGGRRKPSSAAA